MHLWMQLLGHKLCQGEELEALVLDTELKAVIESLASFSYYTWRHLMKVTIGAVQCMGGSFSDQFADPLSDFA